MNKIEELERRIKELEEKLNQSSNMFGRSYSLIGSSDSDFLIKTRGLVKLLYGSKFIDLIKDGKINVDSKFIYTTKEIGSKDGIYVTDNDITLVAGGKPINIKGEVGNTYVSFLGNQETNSELKRLALINIGFLYPSLKEVDPNSLKNGIIYIENERKLYTIINGKLSEFEVSIPNPFTNLFIISKTDDNTGAIIIQGVGLKNSLAFNKMYIYTDINSNVILSDINLDIIASNLNLSAMTNIKGTLRADNIESTFNPRESGGYRIYRSEGNSILEIDKIIERQSNNLLVSPGKFYLNNRIIRDANVYRDPDENIIGILVTFTQKHSYKIGDILLAYSITITPLLLEVNEETGNISVYDYKVNILKINNVPDSNSIIVETDSNDLMTLAGDLIGQLTFLVKSTSDLSPLRIVDNNLDIVYYNLEDLSEETIHARIGELSPLGLKEINDNLEVLVLGNGIYAGKALFDTASYVSTYNLPEDDNSSKFATTEWVRKLVNNELSKL